MNKLSKSRLSQSHALLLSSYRSRNSVSLNHLNVYDNLHVKFQQLNWFCCSLLLIESRGNNLHNINFFFTVEGAHKKLVLNLRGKSWSYTLKLIIHNSSSQNASISFTFATLDSFPCICFLSMFSLHNQRLLSDVQLVKKNFVGLLRKIYLLIERFLPCDCFRVKA